MQSSALGARGKGEGGGGKKSVGGAKMRSNCLSKQLTMFEAHTTTKYGCLRYHSNSCLGKWYAKFTRNTPLLNRLRLGLLCVKAAHSMCVDACEFAVIVFDRIMCVHSINRLLVIESLRSPPTRKIRERENIPSKYTATMASTLN